MNLPKTKKMKIFLLVWSAFFVVCGGAYGATVNEVIVESGNNLGRTVPAGDSLDVTGNIEVTESATATAVGVKVNGGDLTVGGEILVERGSGGTTGPIGAEVYNGGTIVVDGVAIVASGRRAKGVEIKDGSSGSIDVTDITAAGEYSRGIHMIDSSGSVDITQITASGPTARGILLSGSTIDVSADRIVATGNSAYGISTFTGTSGTTETGNTPGSNATISVNEIVVSGDRAQGISFGAHNDIDLTAGSVSVVGNNSRGIRLSQGTVNITDDVTVAGNDSRGVYITTKPGSGDITIGGKVQVEGTGSYGAYIYDGGNITISGGIEASGDNVQGVYVEAGGNLSVTGDTTVSGNNSGNSKSYGIHLTGTRDYMVSSLDVVGNVTAFGDETYGIYVSTKDGFANVSGDITASDGATGILIRTSTTADVNGTVTADGDGSLGIEVFESGNTLNAEKVVATGTGNALGLKTTGGTVTLSGDASGQNMSVTGANNIGAQVLQAGTLNTTGTTTLDGKDLTGVDIQSTGKANLDVLAIEGGSNNVGVTLVGSNNNASVTINEALINGASDQGNNTAVRQSVGTSTIGYLLAGTADSTGLDLSNGTSTIGSLDVTGTDATGVYATGGTVTLTTANVTGDGAVGLRLIHATGFVSDDLIVDDGGTGATVNDSRLNISRDLIVTDGEGVIVQDSGILNVVNETTVSGNNATGVIVSPDGTATLKTLSVDQNGTGARVDGGVLTVNDLLTVLTGGTGVIATSGDTFLSSGDISGGSTGLLASGTASVDISEDWVVSGTGSKGIVMSEDAKVVMQKNLTASGDAYGAYVDGGTLTVLGTVTAGDRSYGVFATSGDSYLDNVVVTGVNAFGVYASNDANIYVSNDITISGDATGSYGAVADSGGFAEVLGSIVSSADNTHGAYVSGDSGGSIHVGNNIIMRSGDSFGAWAETGVISVDKMIMTVGDRSAAATALNDGVVNAADIVVLGELSLGARAAEGGTVNVSNDVTLGDDAAGSTGAYALFGGMTNVSGDIKSTATGTDFLKVYGAYADVAGTVNVAGSIDMSGDYSYGATTDSGDINVGGNIDIEGRDGYGANADDGGTIDVLLSILTSGDKTFGATANHASEINVGENVTVQGDGAHGVWSSNGSSVDVKGSVTTYGGADYVNALYADAVVADSGGYVNVDGNAITHGEDAYGVNASNGGTRVHIGGNVETSGDLSVGVGAYDLAVVSVDGRIITRNNDATGARALDGGEINVGDGILTFGDYSTAAYAFGQSISGDRSTINIIDLVGGGDTIVLTTGANSHGLLAIASGEINMTQGTIRAVDDTSWHMYTNTGGNINLFDVSADASATLNLLKTDSSGNVHATASRLRGDITHSSAMSGDLNVLMDGATQFYGAANASEDVPDARISITLDAISGDSQNSDYWYVTKDSNMQGDLTNRGWIDFNHPTSADFNGLNAFVVDDSEYKKITIDNFFGSDPASVDILGRMEMKADINANKGDYVHGVGFATGSNEIDLQMMTYAGAERMGQALVRMENGAGSDAILTLMDNEVTAGGVADAGAWNYVLEEGMNGLAKEWYLKRNGLTSLGQGLVQGAVTPEMWYTEVATLYDRMANYKDPSYKGGIWASASYRKVEFDGDGNTYGMLPFDVEMKTLTIGYDQKNNHSNGTWYHGIMMGYGREERDSWVGDADTDSFHATIYTVYKQHSGFYLSALAKFNHYDTDLTVNAVDKLTKQFGYDQVVGGMNQRGLGMSLMAGQRFNMGNDGWYFEPQAQLSYMRIFGDKYVTNSGLDVDVEATTSLRARAGFLFGKAMLLNNGAQLDLFADLSINKEFDGETDIWMSGGKFTRDLGDTWGSYGFGFSWRMNDRSYLGGRIAYGSGSDREEPISATLGILFETN